MNKPEWMPLYVTKFTGSATVLRMSHVGGFAYVLLLCQAWHQTPPGTIPDDDDTLAAWARLKPSAWRNVREEVLRAFEKGDDGRWHQRFMVTQAEKSYGMLEQRRQAGRASANARSTTVQRPMGERSTGPVVVGVGVSSFREENTNTPTTPTTTVERSLNDRSPGTVKMTGRELALYHKLLERPIWIPDGQGWIEACRARDIAKMPTTSMALIEYWIKHARSDKRIVTVAGFLISKLSKPDLQLAESLMAQEDAA